MEKEYLQKSTYLFSHNECAIGGQYQDFDIIKNEVEKIDSIFFKRLNTDFLQSELVYIPNNDLWYIQCLAKNPRITIACFFTAMFMQNEYEKALGQLINSLENYKKK